ncbi:MAG: YbaY family lipoprotein [Burkholderiales bacterium]
MPRVASIFLAALFLAGCSSPGAASSGGGEGAARVTGTVTYLQRIALPPTAVIKVQLVDVSRADAAAIVIGEQIIQVGGKQMPFALRSRTIPRGSYRTTPTRCRRASRSMAGPWFISDTRYAVTSGAPTQVDVVLKAAGGPAPK